MWNWSAKVVILFELAEGFSNYLTVCGTKNVCKDKKACCQNHESNNFRNFAVLLKRGKFNTRKEPTKERKKDDSTL